MKSRGEIASFFENEEAVSMFPRDNLDYELVHNNDNDFGSELHRAASNTGAPNRRTGAARRWNQRGATDKNESADKFRRSRQGKVTLVKHQVCGLHSRYCPSVNIFTGRRDLQGKPLVVP